MLATDDPYSIPKTVIFFPTKKEAVEGFAFLQRSATQKYYVGAYHASLTEETKSFVRQSFSLRTTEMRCLCATVAFGMVRCLLFLCVCYMKIFTGNRLVIVYSVTHSISQFYQVKVHAYTFFSGGTFLYCVLQMSGWAG